MDLDVVLSGDTVVADPPPAGPPAESAPPDPIASEKAETKKALSGVQKRIDELTRAKYEAEERGRQEAEGWRQQAIQIAQQYEQLQRNATPVPRLEQYPDLEKYTEAMSAFQAQRIASAERQAAERQFYANQQQVAIQQQQIAAQQQFEQIVAYKVEAAIKKYPDFVQVVSSPELPGIRQTPAFRAILESEHGAEVMYYLGKNPAKAHQLVSLSPVGQIREIGRIEAAIATGRAVTGATPPPEIVGGNRGGATKDPATMSYDEFVAWRRKTVAQRR